MDASEPITTACRCRATQPTTRTSASSDDVKLFVDRTLDIGVGLLNSMVTLASFVVILWGLSTPRPCTCSVRSIAIPGYLVWGALIYAVLGTVLTHWIGWPLVGIDFRQQQFEADFRFNLVRVRENSEQIALLRGEPRGGRRASGSFQSRGGELAMAS